MHERLIVAVGTRKRPFRIRSIGAALRPCTNPLRGIGVVCGAYPAPEPLTDEASKVGALPQTPPGAEPLDLNTYARFR